MYMSLYRPSLALPFLPAYDTVRDYGVGWSHTYNYGVYDSSNPPAAGSKDFYFPNKSHFTFTASAVPSAGQPHVSCTVPNGTPMLVEWDYDPNNTAGYYTITFPDRTQWRMIPTRSQWYDLGQITDRTGHAITFQFAGSNPLLSTITDVTSAKFSSR